MSLASSALAAVQAIGADVKAILKGRQLRDRTVYQLAAVSASTTTTNIGISPASTGTATAYTPAPATSYSAAIRRVDYLVTTAATTAVAGLRSGVLVYRGTASNAGWLGRMIGGPATGPSTTSGTARFFMGLRASTSAPTDVNPSTLVNMFGVGYDAADTQLQIMTNDATGTATKTALGANFPKPTADRSVMYDLVFQADPGSSSISYTVTELVSGATASGSVSTDLPAVNTMLVALLYSSVGGTSSVVGCSVVDWYFETGR